MQDNSGETLPHIIISSINLRQSCIGILRECLDASNNLILHHNLAPFQYRIICECIGKHKFYIIQLSVLS